VLINFKNPEGKTFCAQKLKPTFFCPGMALFRGKAKKNCAAFAPEKKQDPVQQ